MLFGPGVTELDEREADERDELIHARTVEGVGGRRSCTILPMESRDAPTIRRLEATDPRRPRGAPRALLGPRVPAPHPRRLDAVHRRRRRGPLRPRPARAGCAEPSMVSRAAAARRPRRSSGAAGGYRKRVLYLEPSVLGEALIGPSVDRPDVLAAGFAARSPRLHDALVVRRRRARGGDTARTSSSSGSGRSSGRWTSTADPAPPDAAEALRAFLDARPVRAGPR